MLPFLRWWPRVDRSSTRADLVAGATGALLGLPQGVAFALLAGLPPEYGLYAAMVPPALAALFGSSWHMIAGPTNAVAILLLASVGSLAAPGSANYVSLVLTVTLLTGFLQLVMGIARLGGLDLSPDSIGKVAPIALANTILALTLAIGVGRSIGIRSGQRIDNNQEFIGQGISNLAGAFFSSFPSAGSFNRSAANYEAGAKTPLAAVYGSLFLVAIVLVVAPLTAYLPCASMAAILLLIAYGLVDLGHLRAIAHTSRPESAVLFVTLIAALFFGLQTAIYAGVRLSLMLFLNQAAHPGILDVKPAQGRGAFHFDADTGLPDCPQLKILRVNGSIFFGAVEHVEDAFRRIDREAPHQKHLLIVASGINMVDISGAEMLAREARRRRAMGGGLYIWFMKDAVRDLLRRGGYMNDIGEDNVFAQGIDVIAAIYARLDVPTCRDCRIQIFAPCVVALPDGERRHDPVAATR
ncbi:MAG: SulP family inorganic anion transporter [Casimicrobiaceae bacterium]